MFPFSRVKRLRAIVVEIYTQETGSLQVCCFVRDWKQRRLLLAPMSSSPWTQHYCMANHPKPSAKNAPGDSRPFTRSDFFHLLRRASTTKVGKPAPRAKGKS